ncbi:glycoside hydrolase family 18 protein [Acrocarpospora catenulata]|uniref:glycoside hydrolase family 18 protein n=1 Tax=Acrocarpospora catenulata TaxID=2836182 RepID=UPI0027DFD305|nr:glycosyl hydrolase family 18 protein [Acrocarpospora catenulata]
MGATTRGAFAVLVLAMVVAALFLTWYTPPYAQAVERATTSKRVTLGRTPTPAVTVTVTATPRPRGPLIAHVRQRGLFGGTYTIKGLDLDGTAARLTYLNYGYANIHPEELTCLNGVTMPPGADPADPRQGDGAGDAWADYQRAFSAAESVDGVADLADAPLAGNFNQLRKLKAKYPGLKVLISIGGWTYSKYFSDVARTEAGRERFVKSCVDMYLRGDLPLFGTRGGIGVGGGVFDGIDVDWEWPGGPGHAGNHVSKDDPKNLTALLAEFRAQLDALGEAAGRRFLLTAFVPADRELLRVGWESAALRYLDFANVQEQPRSVAHVASEAGSPV